MTEPPLPDTYWVVDGLLLAGGYAGDRSEEAARSRIESLLDAGVRLFIDLTEPGELPSYARILQDAAGARGERVDYIRAPIRDFDVPSDDELAEVLAAIDRALASKQPVYVHCHGGIGRTGTVVGCWLAQNGYPGEAALERLARLRSTCPAAYGRSPEADSQRDLVKRWAKRRSGSEEST